MSEIKFSLLIPSRERYSMVSNLLVSIDRTVYDPTSVEILFAVDNDDTKTVDFINGMKNQVPRLNITIHTRERTEFINKDYYNWLGGLAKGKYLWVLGNDLVFHTPNWDKIIEDKIETDIIYGHSDRVFCIGVNDGTPKPSKALPDFPCFPLISKEAFQALGFLLNPEIPTWGADYFCWCIYHGVDRLYYMKNIVLEHISYHTRKVPVDDVNRRIGEIYAKNKPLHTHVLNNVTPQNIDTLKRYINERNH